MVRAYLENAQTIIGRVPYHLRQLVISLEDSPVAMVGLNQLWVPSTLMKYCALMTKLLITMVRSRDNNPVDDKPIINVLGNLHSDLADALDDFVFYTRGRQDADRDDEACLHPHGAVAHLPAANMSCRSARATNYLSNIEVPDCEQLAAGPFVDQPRFQTCSTCDRSHSHSPVLVEMHNPHAVRASNVATGSPSHPLVRS
jgi:hypothetical protein